VYDWLIRTALEYHVDAVVLGGDLLGCPDGFATPEDAQQHDAHLLSEFLADAGLPILYIMGNDDLVELNSGSERVQSIHGRRVQSGLYNFVGYQYSLPFMGGTFEKPEESIRVDLADLDGLMDNDTIFVSHSPALGTLDPGLDETRIGTAPCGNFSTKTISGTHSRPQPFRVWAARPALQRCVCRSGACDDSEPGDNGTSDC
jgi:Icc-related predicted phosphoesterase